METYSVSSIKRGLSCSGLKFDNSSIYLEKGNIIHSILSDGNDYSKSYTTYRGEVKKYVFDHDFEEYERIAKDVIETYPHLFTDDWHIEEELHFTVKDSLLGEIELSGILDRYKIVGDKCHIVDWKTGQSKADINNSHDTLQAYFYTLLIMMMYPNIKYIVFEYIYVERDETIQIITKDISEDTKKNLYRYIKMFIFSVQQSKGSYKINNSCKHCTQRTVCPLVDNELNLLQLEKDRLGLESIRRLKTLITSIYEARRDDLLETAESKDIKTMSYFYVSKADISDETLRELASDTMRVTKKLAEELINKGITVSKKETRALK